MQVYVHCIYMMMLWKSGELDYSMKKQMDQMELKFSKANSILAGDWRALETYRNMDLDMGQLLGLVQNLRCYFLVFYSWYCLGFWFDVFNWSAMLIRYLRYVGSHKPP